MKNIIRRIVLWADKGKVFVFVTCVIAFFIGVISWNAMWGLFAFMLQCALKAWYEAFMCFEDVVDDFDRKMISGFCSLLLCLLGYYFLMNYWGGKFLNETPELPLRVACCIFGIALLFYIIVRLWIYALRYAKGDSRS